VVWLELPGSEQPVARIAETREDIALGIELSIQGGTVYLDVRMLVAQPVDALWSSYQA
jgi:hypothetical protein